MFKKNPYVQSKFDCGLSEILTNRRFHTRVLSKIIPGNFLKIHANVSQLENKIRGGIFALHRRTSLRLLNTCSLIQAETNH